MHLVGGKYRRNAKKTPFKKQKKDKKMKKNRIFFPLKNVLLRHLQVGYWSLLKKSKHFLRERKFIFFALENVRWWEVIEKSTFLLRSTFWKNGSLKVSDKLNIRRKYVSEEFVLCVIPRKTLVWVPRVPKVDISLDFFGFLLQKRVLGL